MEAALIALVIAAFVLRRGSSAPPGTVAGRGGAPPPSGGAPSVGTIVGAVPVVVGGIKAVGTIGTAVGGAVGGGGAAAGGGAAVGGGAAAEAGGGAAATAGTSPVLVGAGVAAAMAALIAAGKWREAVSDRAVNARVLEQALEKMLRAIMAEVTRRERGFGAWTPTPNAVVIAREWAAAVSNELKQYLPIAASWVRAQYDLASAARKTAPDAPQWADMVRGTLTDGTQLDTPLPILAGNAYAVDTVFEFFRRFPSAPYFVDTDGNVATTRDRTGAVLPQRSLETMAADFAAVGIGAGLTPQEFLYHLWPESRPKADTGEVDYSSWNAGGG